MRTICGTILVAAALVAIGWFGREAVGFKEKPRSDRAREDVVVTAVTVANAAFNPPVEYVGHVESVQSADVLPQI